MKIKKRMFEILSAGIILIMLFSSATALSIVKPSSEIDTIERSVQGDRDPYTHTVFVEVGTATWCPSCPASNNAWHSIYGSGNYDFEYCELVVDKNSAANSHMNNNYNLYWLPTSYFDGGQYVYPGTSYSTFYNNLDSSGARVVPDLVAELNVEGPGDAQLDISLSITNNEAVDYLGHLRVYIIELESTLWNDNSGNPYYHAFLDFAFNQAINIPAEDIYTDSIVWDGVSEGFPDILYNNIQVILSVFDDEPHQAYSDPFHQGSDPTWAPFWAYYVDETIASLPEYDNVAPDAPIIDGPTSGTAGEEYEYTFSAEDSDGNDVYLWIEWDDDNSSDEWIGPYDSGEEVTIAHTWDEEGIYAIQAKAKDGYDFEGEWGTLEVEMPVSNSEDIGSTFLRGFITKPRIINGGRDITFRAIRLHYNSLCLTERNTGVFPVFEKVVLPNDYNGFIGNHYVFVRFDGKLDI